MLEGIHTHLRNNFSEIRMEIERVSGGPQRATAVSLKLRHNPVDTQKRMKGPMDTS